MRVRARVNQADINELQAGHPVRIGLDAYPDLFFTGRVAQISPIGGHVDALAKGANVHRADRRRRLSSQPDAGPHGIARRHSSRASPRARRAARRAPRPTANRTFVRVQRGGGFEDRLVTIASLNAHEAMVTSGLDDGAVIARNVQSTSGRQK